MAAFIAAQRTGYQIPRAVSCRALGVSRSWHYKWSGRGLPPRAARRERLKAEIGRLFGAHEGKYGSPRITADLKDAGWAVSKNTVAALMREMGLAARPKRKRRATTRPGRAGGTPGRAEPGQAGLPRGPDQRQVVRRRHRYRHR